MSRFTVKRNDAGNWYGRPVGARRDRQGGGMMSEVQHERMMEDAAAGDALLRSVANYFGVEASMGRVKRAIYKHTDCGAWLDIDSRGLVLGSIVEGSDAEVGPFILSMAKYLEMSLYEFTRWMMDTIDTIEREAERLWCVANCEPRARIHYGTVNGPACGARFYHAGITAFYDTASVTCARCKRTRAFRVGK